MQEALMRWISLVALVLLGACASTGPGQSTNWVRPNGTVLNPDEAQQASATCIGQMSNQSDTQAAASTTPGASQAFNRQVQNSSAAEAPSSAEINTCMNSRGYRPAY
jgi:hypothetical protein